MRFAPPRRRWTLLCLLLILVIGLASQAEASDGVRGDKCEVAEDAYITEDFYFFCRILNVRGTIDGDLIGVAAEITLHRSGVVTGDLWIGGGKLYVEGTVGDDIHFGGLTLLVADKAHFTQPRIDVVSVALNTEIMPNAVLPGDLLVYGYQAKVAGTVGGDVDFGGETLLIDGMVVGLVDADVGDAQRNTNVPSLPIYDISFEDPGLWIGAQARIEQDVIYRSASKSEIPPGVVEGRTRFHQTGGQPDITKAEQPNDAVKILANYFRTALTDIMTLMILGVVGLRLFPDFIRQPAQYVRRHTISTIGWGLLTFMLFIPVMIVVLVIGLLLVLVLYLIHLNALTLLVGGGLLIVSSVLAGSFSFLLFFMGRVIVSFMIGQLIDRYIVQLRFAATNDFRRRVLTLAVGVVAYALLINVPLPAIGLMIDLVTALAGVGAVIMYFRNVLDAVRLQISQPAVVRPPSAPVLSTVPQLMLTTPEPPPGLDNLPDGFTGFDEDW